MSTKMKLCFLTKLWLSSLLVLNCFVLHSWAQSGDGEASPFLISEDDDTIVGHNVIIDNDDNFVTEKSSLDIYIVEEDANGTVHDNSSVTFFTPQAKNETDVDNKFISRSALGPIIFVIILVALIIFGCLAWRIISLRKKRNRGRVLRNHILSRNLSESEKGSKELVEIRREPQKNIMTPQPTLDEIQPLSEKEIREEAATSLLPFQAAPLPVTFTTFQTPATVSRLSPPPTYEEYLHASTERMSNSERNSLSDFGPSYR